MTARTRLLAAALICGVLGAGTSADASQRGRGGPQNTKPNPSDVPNKRSGISLQQMQQRGSRPSAEPAFAAGYAAGHARGRGDGREGGRYDPVRHTEYRDAEAGYSESYGSKDAYRNNYRAGFRQGYEDGYRSGSKDR